MTFDERVAALAPLGFTPRQTRFLVTAALHSGYCLRRQYLAFAGIRYGKNVCDFLEALVRRHLARRFRYQSNRGHIYHLQAKALYRALAQLDNRNRRQVSPAVIARKLMLLDAVLTVPDAEWYATEEDKVALFTGERGIPLRDLPQRVYAPTHRGLETTRYFMHKLPVYLAPDRSVVHFVYAVCPSVGAAIIGAVIVERLRVAAVAGRLVLEPVLAALLLVAIPIYQARDGRRVEAARISARTIGTIRSDLATLPLSGLVVFHDEPEVSAFREAFGDLASEALRTRFNREWDARIETLLAPSEAPARRGPVIADYWIQRGRIIRASNQRPF